MYELLFLDQHFIPPSVNCGQNGYFLNGIEVDLVKWPTIVESLLKRTKIYQLSIHYGGNLNSLQATSAIFSQLKEIFEQNSVKLQLDLIEFYFHCYSEVFIQIQSFLMFSLQLSIPFLKEFRCIISNEQTKYENPIWPIIQKCNSLNNIHFLIYTIHNNSNMVDIDALVGKPLNEIYISQRNITVDGLARLLDNVDGDGVQTLYFHYCYGQNVSFHLRQIADRFSENARQKLKFLIIDSEDVNNDNLEVLFMIPSMFPKLQELKIYTRLNLHSENIITEVCSVDKM